MPSQRCTIHEVQSYIKFRGQSRVRTYVLVREQIYSLSPLTTRPSARKPFRAGNGTRTRDLLITNQLLYQLSYSGLFIPIHKRALPNFGMAKVMEFFIYQNFRGNFYPKNQKMFRNQ